ncbi:MAG TPA: ATP-binding protein [Gemmatimonadaceae bacterium]|nr:ATP-binding protein [Gemmatimonadaceae bacterium]
MLRIRTLGGSEILVGSERIGPEQPIAFTLVFLLAMRGAVPSSRRELAALLWPDASDADRNHRLRSLLHRLRRLGIRPDCAGASITLRDAAFDFRDLAAPPRSLEDVRARMSLVGAVLPNFSVPSHAALADRIDDARDVIAATATRWLNGALALAKSACDWPLVEQLARATCELDAANESAWLSLAEAQCLTAGQPAALAVIDDYLSRLGAGDALPALILRRRIAEAHASAKRDLVTTTIPLVGRDDALRRMWGAVARARDGHGGAILLWGPAAIGKSRVLDEVGRLGSVDTTRVIRLAARPLHALRPATLILDLIARLLDEPGAAGCEPLAFSTLRRVTATTPNDHASVAPVTEDALFDPLTELLAALTDEAALVVLLDDMHIVDASIWRFWRAACRWSGDRRVLWLFAYRALLESDLGALPEVSLIHRLPLRCLDRAASAALVEAARGQHGRCDYERAFARVGGHPALLEQIVRSDGDHSPSTEAIVEDWLARLPANLLHTLRVIATLGGSATLRSVADRSFLDRFSLGASVAELERLGLLYEENGVVHAHSIWTEAALDTHGGAERFAISI